MALYLCYLPSVICGDTSRRSIACVHMLVCACMYTCKSVFVMGVGAVELLGLSAADVIIRIGILEIPGKFSWSSEAFHLLHRPSTLPIPVPPQRHWPYGKIQHVPADTPSQQSITTNCGTHIVNNKYPKTSCNCNLMALRFTNICDMLV